MGGMAWVDSGMDRDGDESGAARFPAMVGVYRCTQPVAFGHRGPDDLVVSVSRHPLPPSSSSLTLTVVHSFLVKDAQQDMAGARLKA